MEIEKDFLTVAEFAEALGISKQAVYKRQKDLEAYTEMRNGVRYISVSAFSLFSGATEPQKENSDTTAIIKALNAQIETKDKIIADLQKSIVEQNKTLSGIIERQNELQNNFQILLARIYEGKPMLPSSGTEPESPHTQPVEQPVVQQFNNVEQPVETAEKPQEPETKKQSFISKLFKKH